jgi:hypothetical protein
MDDHVHASERALNATSGGQVAHDVLRGVIAGVLGAAEDPDRGTAPSEPIDDVRSQGRCHR